MCLLNTCPRVGCCHAKFYIANSMVVIWFTITKCYKLASTVFQHPIFVGVNWRCFKGLFNVNAK